VTGGLPLLSLLAVCLLSVKRQVTSANPATLPIFNYPGVTRC